MCKASNCIIQKREVHAEASHGECRSTATERKRETRVQIEGGFASTALAHSVRLRLAERAALPSAETLHFSGANLKLRLKTISAKDNKSRKFIFKTCSYTDEREQGREKVTEGVTDIDGKSFREALS